MNQSSSNIKVFPSFPETAFFSGEEFSCILTFKNVVPPTPSSSSATLTPLEGLKNGSRIVNSKIIGAEWMVERGRSASEGVLMSPGAERSSEHSRSLSTSGRTKGERKEKTSSSPGSHTRSQSVIVSPNSADTAAQFENPNTSDEKQEGTAFRRRLLTRRYQQWPGATLNRYECKSHSAAGIPCRNEYYAFVSLYSPANQQIRSPFHSRRRRIFRDK
jgi:hypothetical protein